MENSEQQFRKFLFTGKITEGARVYWRTPSRIPFNITEEKDGVSNNSIRTRQNWRRKDRQERSKSSDFVPRLERRREKGILHPLRYMYQTTLRYAIAGSRYIRPNTFAWEVFLEYLQRALRRDSCDPRSALKAVETCSKCGFVHGQNRNGLGFRCGNCGFSLNADLNASRNIGVLGKSEHLRLFVNEPIVAPDETSPTGAADGSYKPPNLLGGS